MLFEDGVKTIAEGLPVGLYKLLDCVKDAIDKGYAYDADPTWMMSDDYRARPSIVLTAKGFDYAVEKGWLTKCICCGVLKSYRQSMCSTCTASANQYGMKDGMCMFHYHLKKG